MNPITRYLRNRAINRRIYPLTRKVAFNKHAKRFMLNQLIDGKLGRDEYRIFIEGNESRLSALNNAIRRMEKLRSK